VKNQAVDEQQQHQARKDHIPLSPSTYLLHFELTNYSDPPLELVQSSCKITSFSRSRLLTCLN